MDRTQTGKLAALRDWLRGQDRVIVAYSGGVDSTMLAAVAHAELGDACLAVTADVVSFPPEIIAAAVTVARSLGIRHHVVTLDQMAIPGFVANSRERCYHCKREIVGAIQAAAMELGFGGAAVLDGANVDDRGDYRPGSRAAHEAGVLSPLQILEFTKADIRAISRHLRLPTADLPSYACLASRLPYGTAVTEAGMAAIAQVERGLGELGFAVCRGRSHGDVLRIEVPAAAIAAIAAPETAAAVVRVGRSAGFRYVTVDLAGYRTGSMNEVLD